MGTWRTGRRGGFPTGRLTLIRRRPVKWKRDPSDRKRRSRASPRQARDRGATGGRSDRRRAGKAPTWRSPRIGTGAASQRIARIVPIGRRNASSARCSPGSPGHQGHDRGPTSRRRRLRRSHQPSRSVPAEPQSKPQPSRHRRIRPAQAPGRARQTRSRCLRTS
jgi:hypothetical protein